MSSIQEVFGQFAVDLEDGPVLFATEALAAAALSEFENGAAQREEAAEFCAHAGIEAGSKNAKGKSNVIVAYLQWVDAGKPGPEVDEDEDGEDED